MVNLSNKSLHSHDEELILRMTEKTYDAIARFFAPLLTCENASPEEIALLDFFLSLLDKDAIIADLGCGAGKHGRYCASKGFYVCGFDISKKMIEKAEEYNRKDNYTAMEVLQVADMCDFESKHKFDAVISAYSLIHSTSEQAKVMLENLKRHLKPHAHIFATVYRGTRAEICREELAPDHTIYFRDYMENEFVSLIRECGYRILQSESWPDIDPITAGNKSFESNVLCVIAEYCS